METEATQRPPSGSPAATAYPRWVLLSPYADREPDGSYSTADANTLVSGRTSTGEPIGVSLVVAAPPASSRVCFHLPPEVVANYATVVAAHGDSLLIHVVFKTNGWWRDRTHEYFVYNAGAGAADPPRPPSLSLLPPCFLTEQELGRFGRRSDGRERRELSSTATGLLRRGEEDLVVAELRMVAASDDDWPVQRVAELLLFRSGEWCVKRPPVSHDHGDDTLLPSWRAGTVATVGDGGLICWADLSCGLMPTDVFDDTPVLQYVALPAAAMEPHPGRGSTRNVSVTAGGTVKFVNVFPRCCCGGAGATNCRRSQHAYTINTWTLRMDDMVWVMDGMVDATELWSLDAYKGLPCVQPWNPIMSVEEPHVMCFVVCESYFVEGGNITEWQIMIDTRNKTIRSVSSYPINQCGRMTLPSRVTYYLNSYPGSSNGGTSSSLSKNHVDNGAPPPVVIDDFQTNNVTNTSVQFSCNSSAKPMQQVSEIVSPEKKILAALEEIPDLARDDMLKAYSILSHDNGRRFRSLMELPMSLRKDWLLMEIKAWDACSICSTCTTVLQCD
ncbi:hypothetical protein ACP70R_008846 [Stipagrostis hirtigluma subsp. patula]